MTIVCTLPVKTHCEKCGWTEELDYEKHGPDVHGPLFLITGGLDLKNKPTTCPTCRNPQLKEEFGPILSLKGHPLYSEEWVAMAKKRD